MTQTMGKNERFISGVLGLIRDAYGESTADLYKRFYADKPIGIIEVSADELFRETFGMERAEREMNRIRKDARL